MSFMGLVYSQLKEWDVDTSKLTPKEAVEMWERLKEEKEPCITQGKVEKQGKNKENNSGGIPFHKVKQGYNDNCTACVTAYELRRRGYNVQAKSSVKNDTMALLSYNPQKAFIGGKFTEWDLSQGNIVDFLEKKIDNNERYFIQYHSKGMAYFHIITAESINGDLQLYDPQCGRVIPKIKISKYFKNLIDLNYVRVDNLEFKQNIVSQVVVGVRSND